MMANRFLVGVLGAVVIIIECALPRLSLNKCGISARDTYRHLLIKLFRRVVRLEVNRLQPLNAGTRQLCEYA